MDHIDRTLREISLSRDGAFFKAFSASRSLCALWCCALAGCASTPATEPSDQTRTLGHRLFSSTDAQRDVAFEDDKPGNSTEPFKRPARTTWAILLSGADGDGHAAKAASLAQLYRNRFGLQGVFIEGRESGSAILLGSFADPAQGQKDLQAIRGIQDQGDRPFARALMVPPPMQTAGKDAKLDLAKARRPSDPSDLYSVQIAYFETGSDRPGADEISQVRSQAEKLAAELRSQGEQAYYLHGTGGRSIVTVGIFDTDDTFFQPLRAVLKKHPVNMVNGKPGEIRMANGLRQPQPSVLVKVP